MVNHGSSDAILVFDIGGSHIASCALSSSDLSAGETQQAWVSDSCNCDEFLETIMQLGERSLPLGARLIGASLATPGPADYARGISYMKHKFRELHGVVLGPKLAFCLGCSPDRISFLNDADAFLIGEMHQGAAADAQRAIGITLGTGIGSAFAVAGQLVVEGAGVPKDGEIWNHPYHGDIVENFISTASIQCSFERKTGRRADVRSIAGWAESDRDARETFEEFGSALGQILLEACGAFRPDCIVLGGGIARSASLFLPAAERELNGLSIRVCVSKLGCHAPLIGAGVDWIHKHSTQS
jgi:glucokinase